MNWKKLLSTERAKEALTGEARPREDNQDTRDEFQRDYDRCLFSTAFRRLQDKAQVFPLELNDSVRTRLTHSLEVSNVARSLAERITTRILDEKKGEIDLEDAKQIIIIAATCGLIHDLGNPPFGHSGEDAMREWYQEKFDSGHQKISFEGKEDFENFEGNAQTIRLVSKLQMAGDLSGLNLTLGTLSACRKYISNYKNIDKNIQAFKKLGAFKSEKELIDSIEKYTETKEMRNPITYIVEAADDIVYSVIDIEDGIKKGVLSWELLKVELKGVADNQLNYAEQNIYKRAKSESFTLLSHKEDTSSDAEFEELKGNAIDQARMTILRTALIKENVTSVIEEFFNKYDEIMKGTYTGELAGDCSTSIIIKTCKKIAAKRVFPSEKIVRLEVMGRNTIKDLMDIFWEGIDNAPYTPKDKGFNKKIYYLISENYRTVFESQYKKSKLEYYKYQLLGDYICGMTDSFACQLHKELKNG